MSDQNHSPILSAQVDGIRQEMFGFSFPFLPDFLSDHTLASNSDLGKIQEILNRWTHFIISLRKWENLALSLRYSYNPKEGAIDIALIGCIPQGNNLPSSLTRSIAEEFQALLKAFNLPGKLLNNTELKRFLAPFADPSIVEIRQHEEVTSFWSMPGEAYVIHPFWRASGSWQLLFETILRQSTEIIVNVFLEPTVLTDDERIGLMQAAQVAQTLSDQEFKTYSDTALRRRRDPQAENVANIYNALLEQLVDPYLLIIQVASPDRSSAHAVARSMGASIKLREDAENINIQGNVLPTGFDIRVPSTPKQIAACRKTFSFMKFEPWGNELAVTNEKNDKARLVYLTGSRGATAAFRFPISVRGGIPGIVVRQTTPDFEPGPRPLEIAPDELCIGNYRRGSNATIKLKELTRHVMVTGFTGSGKTNTVLYLLDQLWSGQRKRGLSPIPFLVIEAAKKEYRGFLDQPGYEDMCVFTLGNETVSPFRLNPFELLPGVRLEAHLGQLQNCFDATLPQFGILPSIIAESMELIYQEKGWDLTDVAGANDAKEFPRLKDLYSQVIAVAESRGYAGEIAQNIRAAVTGRIGSLLRGSKGKMFDCQRSLPLDLLMKSPVVLELDDLNQQDKSITMMFLLMLLREYRQQNKATVLQHVTVVEEAHNVLENVRSVGASEIAPDTRAKAVEAFATMLAEVRAYGEGIIISDQSPEKLSPDAIRNTNLQIAHQLRHRVDREAIAAAMLMDEAQQDYLGKLGVGAAAVFVTGFDQATFIQIPNFKESAHFVDPSDAVVREKMSSFRKQHVQAYLPCDGCRFCTSQCKFENSVLQMLKLQPYLNEYEKAQRRFKEFKKAEQQPDNWLFIAKVCSKIENVVGQPGVLDAGWCYLVHQVPFHFTDYMRSQYKKAHAQLGK